MIRTVVIGAGGYSGAELVGLLLQHGGVEIAGLFGSSSRAAEQPVSFADQYPRFRGRIDLTIKPTDVNEIAALSPDVVFLATPNETSHDLAPELLERGWVVIDLSGAFRLADPALYPKFYGFEHQHAKLLHSAVYGLPELNRGKLADADLIACPGCYPTSAILPLHPLVKAGAIRPGTRPIVDATSGVSGAGRTPTHTVHFCEVSLQPYNVMKHRHNPEIDRHSGVNVVFTPHLGAFDRGILSTIHVELAEGWTGGKVGELYKRSYGEEPFVRLFPAEKWPSVAAVRGTNFCDIGWKADDADKHLIVVSAIDNLVKGAAGQALQCLNARFGLPETTGLIQEGAPCPAQ